MAKKYFELLNIQHNKDYTWEALGISEERFDVLEKELIYERHQKKREKISQSLAYLAKQCESIEELAYVCYALGKDLSPKCGILPVPMPGHLSGPIDELLDDIVKSIEKRRGKEDSED